MSKTAAGSKKVRWWPWLIGVIAVYIGYWYVIWISGWFSELEKGEFGDTFGALNALFAGLAFAGVIYAILLQQKELALQRKELALQRKELEDTRVEIRGQKEQLQAQNQTLQKQNFESSFFQLLNRQSEIVNSMEIEKDEPSGRACFGRLFRILSSYYSDTAQAQNDTSKTEVDIINDVYEKLFFYFQTDIDHYFRHLYHVVKFVDVQKDFPKGFREKKRYIDFIRAQLSSDELWLLFYYGLSKRGTEFGVLAEIYALFEDIHFQKNKEDINKVLMTEEHRTLYAASAYGESD